MKRIANTLSTWSRNEFGDIFAAVKDYEDRVKSAKDDVINNNIAENRTKLHQVNADYIRHLKIEEVVLKQKTQLH